MSNDRYSVDFAGPMLPAMLHALMLARNTAMMCQAPGLMDAFQEKFDALAAQAGIPDLLVLVDERAWFSACEALPKATAFHWYVHTGWSGDEGTPSLIVDGTEHKVAGHELRTDHPQFPAIRDFLERYANPAVTRGEDEAHYCGYAEMQRRRNPPPLPEPEKAADRAEHAGYGWIDEDDPDYDPELDGEADLEDPDHDDPDFGPGPGRRF